MCDLSGRNIHLQRPDFQAAKPTDQRCACLKRLIRYIERHSCESDPKFQKEHGTSCPQGATDECEKKKDDALEKLRDLHERCTNFKRWPENEQEQKTPGIG